MLYSYLSWRLPALRELHGNKDDRNPAGIQTNVAGLPCGCKRNVGMEMHITAMLLLLYASSGKKQSVSGVLWIQFHDNVCTLMYIRYSGTTRDIHSLNQDWHLCHKVMGRISAWMSGMGTSFCPEPLPTCNSDVRHSCAHYKLNCWLTERIVYTFFSTC